MSLNQNFAAMNLNQANPQQSGLTNIQVSVPTGTTATQRALTGELINRNTQKAIATGENAYWRVDNPGRQLQLSGAVRYVTKNFPNTLGAQRFVYWPTYRVVGSIEQIASAFQGAGVPITQQQIANEAIDPLNPNWRAQLDNMSAQRPARQARAARETYPLEVGIAIGKALKASRRKSTTAEGSATVSTGAGTGRRAATGGARGGRSPQSNQQALINAFNAAMAQALAGGQVEKVFDVIGYNAAKFTNARRVAPPKTARATSVRPTLLVNGRPVALPLISQPGGAGNLAAFVQGIVSQSQYAQYAPQIMAAFNEALA